MSEPNEVEAAVTAGGAVGTAAPGEQRFELKITATGEVRDKDGNLISSEPIEATAVLTEDEIRGQLDGFNRGPAA